MNIYFMAINTLKINIVQQHFAKSRTIFLFNRHKKNRSSFKLLKDHSFHKSNQNKSQKKKKPDLESLSPVHLELRIRTWRKSSWL